MVGYAVGIVVEGKVAVFWEGVNGVGHAVGIAVAQAAVLVEIGDKGHTHFEIGGVAKGPQPDEGTALLEVLEVVDHSFESDISASEIGDAELESGFLDAGIVQGVAVVVHDEAVSQRHVVERADFDVHRVVGTPIAHVVDFAQD